MAEDFAQYLKNALADAGMEGSVDTLCGTDSLIAVVPGKPVIHITALEVLNNSDPARMKRLVNSRISILSAA